MTKPPVAIVLAAGMGTRMNSELPKVLSQVCGRPLIDYVLDALAAAGVQRVLAVVGYQADQVRAAVAGRPNVECVLQAEQKGTGHAVKMCRDHLLDHDGPVVVLAGDSPMVQSASIAKLLEEAQRDRPACILGTLETDRPDGLGRILRDSEGRFSRIVEEKEATAAERGIKEVNMSTYVFDCRQLLHALERIRNDNRKKEYYVTDCPGILKSEGKEVRALPVLQPCEALSVNTIEELAAVEAEMRKMGC
jgi:bifunctional UDP-N-acetylglucosamine pyrophosphorylase/glucosamine-1-phosphate N-acetyltransferase/UDP-N-acetylglucosamine pyrophosphorylase